RRPKLRNWIQTRGEVGRRIGVSLPARPLRQLCYSLPSASISTSCRGNPPDKIRSWRKNSSVAGEIKSLFIPGPVGRLEALLNTGAADATHAALICHPHPMFGGTMHNKVVFAAMKALN